MKKLLLLLLAGALLLPFAACTVDPTDPSADLSSDDTSETSSDDSAHTPAYRTLVSVGKPYTCNTPACSPYLDMYGQQLTDGFKLPDTGAFYTDARMVGYNSNNNFIIDLGEDGKQLTEFVVRSLDVSQDGVMLAATARFYGSDDGENWNGLGRANFKSSGDRTVGNATVKLDTPVDYRYVRASVMLRSGSAFFFTDEIEVYANVPPKASVSTLEATYANEKLDHASWKALSTGVKAEPVASTNLALGKTYTLGGAAIDERAKESSDANALPLLTDGAATGRLFGESVWLGLGAKDAPAVTLDLGAMYGNLYAFRVHALNGAPSVRFADAIDVYGSKDNTAFTLLGRMYAPDGGSNHTYVLLLPEYVEARYIRFSFSAGGEGDYYWIEELEVCAGESEQQSGELFPPVTFDPVTEELFWNSSEPDYKKVQNLLLGRPQKIGSSDYRSLTLHGDETGSDTTLLTDGKLASTTYCYNGEYFFSRGGAALDFFYDLSCISTVQELRICYLEHGSYGIANPRYATAFLSEDGENWYAVGDFTGGAWDSSGSAMRKTIEWKLERPYTARFVRFRIESAFLFVDELEAIGTKAVGSSAVRLADSGLQSVIYHTDADKRQFATTENTPIKASDIALVYGNYGDENTLLPMVAYLDEDGNIQDTFMDGFLYCLSGPTPSGAYGHHPNRKSDWEFMLDITVNGVNGMDRLNEVVGQVKDALDRPDYRVQVYFTILTVISSVEDFGDVDGDGVTESLATPEGRKKAVDWYVQLCRSTFEERKYENLELGGFYWINEAVNWDNDDSDIIKEVVSYVHENGEYMLWIPYYQANRVHLAYELGFDLVSMQPNYMFSMDKPLSNFTHAAEFGLTMQAAVEIEHSYQAFSDPIFVRNYMLYLYYGAVYGYIDSVHIYYDDLENFTGLCYSDSPLCRMQYDATYQFVKGTLQIVPETRAAVTFTAQKDTVLRGDLGVEGELANYSLAISAQHGSVTLCGDGTFLYFPEKGFTGKDTFFYTYNEYLGESANCAVEITVG